jgi:hypothetical protein
VGTPVGSSPVVVGVGELAAPGDPEGPDCGVAPHAETAQTTEAAATMTEVANGFMFPGYRIMSLTRT